MLPPTVTDYSEITLTAGSRGFPELPSSASSVHGAATDVSTKKRHIHRPMHKLDSSSDIVRGFSPAWFTTTMGTGITGILLYNFPYRWAPLEYIGMAIALFNLILYVLFTVLLIWRLVRYRDFYSMLLHPQMSMLLGTIPMGLCTVIISLVIMITPYGAPWVPTLALVLWCIAVVLSVFSYLVIPFTAITHQKQTLEQANATMLLPVVTPVVAASAGAIVCSVHDGGAATVILFISYILWAMGVGLSMMITIVYLVRLTVFKLPPKEAIVSVFIPLGPLGQSSYGIQLLGTQALRLFPEALPHINYLGEVLYSTGFFMGLLIWSLAIWWFFHALYSVIYTRAHGQVPFSLGWWALIFPVGTFASSSSALWTVSGYTVFRVFNAILNSIVLVLWVLIMANTIRYAWTGELLKPASIGQLELQDKPSSSDNEDNLEHGPNEQKNQLPV
ncbi:Plasma membrane sulfite pump involved in sulfite metabolism [Coemansia sp. RSA 1813]|nr:Plasma membrane sulfite pump involved in sulfite metabolism [Coemansia sp. RSA 1646]KAJ1769957.1 Plasma membrane sulfite pump involved in sulfite metabolism [Coemansia sp. RSA 1843]KAJ2087868.1 Plasma membrane sulfite pump involved in sulfite metabolism [Coemansia sp. RSA 986]KAJ2212760.1 Plasma membrane sulfite pump involved in sulfite metabolism [Coemansia sp. RSA 487]KAJ2567499.1 Plasma membrane sulfite pump involved in sulfite metabolism [Coemansia sp. RSA 1813]